MDIETIHESLINGQRRQMVEQIDEYGVVDFWEDYKVWLSTSGINPYKEYDGFADAVISYHRIKER